MPSGGNRTSTRAVDPALCEATRVFEITATHAGNEGVDLFARRAGAVDPQRARTSNAQGEPHRAPQEGPLAVGEARRAQRPRERRMGESPLDREHPHRDALMSVSP